MTSVVFVAQCMDKTHTEDVKTVEHLLRIKGIEDAFETYVSYQDKEYCLAAISLDDSNQHSRIISEIQNDKNIKSIKMLTPEEVPF